MVFLLVTKPIILHVIQRWLGLFYDLRANIVVESDFEWECVEESLCVPQFPTEKKKVV